MLTAACCCKGGDFPFKVKDLKLAQHLVRCLPAPPLINERSNVQYMYHADEDFPIVQAGSAGGPINTVRAFYAPVTLGAEGYHWNADDTEHLQAPALYRYGAGTLFRRAIGESLWWRNSCRETGDDELVNEAVPYVSIIYELEVFYPTDAEADIEVNIYGRSPQLRISNRYVYNSYQHLFHATVDKTDWAVALDGPDDTITLNNTFVCGDTGTEAPSLVTPSGYYASIP